MNCITNNCFECICVEFVSSNGAFLKSSTCRTYSYITCYSVTAIAINILTLLECRATNRSALKRFSRDE